MTIGDKLKKWRTDNNITTNQIQRELGITKSAISNAENNKSLPSLKILMPLSQQYGLDLNWLIDLEDTSDPMLLNDIDMLEKYKILSSDEKNVIQQMVHILAKKAYK